MTETLENGYSSERTHRELYNEYQHDSFKMFFKNLCVLVLRMKVGSALEGLKTSVWQQPVGGLVLSDARSLGPFWSPTPRE